MAVLGRSWASREEEILGSALADGSLEARVRACSVVLGARKWAAVADEVA
jgi:hypothetical protein